MKKIAFVLITLIIIVMLLGACGIHKNDNNVIENNATQKPNSEISTQNLPIKSTEISIQELKHLLNLKKSEILNVVNGQIEKGTISIMESHMVFPIIYVKDLGLTFVFPNETDDLRPIYIVVNGETNFKNVNIKNAKPGMNFKEIMRKMGDNQVVKMWFSNENNVAYKLDYIIDGLVYVFVSYDEQGEGSQRRITALYNFER